MSLNGILESFGEVGTKPSIPTYKKPFDFEKGIWRAGDVAAEMEHGFIHGKKRGLTTFIPELDPHFTFRRGLLHAHTGWPQHGKTEVIQYLALLQAIFAGHKWAVFSVENYPQSRFFDTLAHAFVGKSTDPKYKGNQMTLVEYRAAISFLHEHFFYVYFDKMANTPELIRQTFEYIHNKYNIFGTIVDPWNKMAHKRKGLSLDDYLAEQFPLEQTQARELDLHKIICAHPRTYNQPRQKGEALPVPDQYSLHGGQTWDSMFDIVTAIYRPLYHQDKASQEAEWHTHKMKMQDLMGIPGMIEMKFNRKTARYYINDKTPLEPHTVEIPQNFNPNNLPESNFEILEPDF